MALAPKKAVLNDSNAELINTWQIIQKYPQKLIKLLGTFQRNFPLKQDYYWYRENYNQVLLSSQKNNSLLIRKAALFIFLNKTCFNGLYRVNSEGKFNVPWNKSMKFNFDKDNLLAISIFLNTNKIKFYCGDFETILKKSMPKDLIYFDPPYDVLKKTSFVAYTKNKFLFNSQIRLAKCFGSLDQKNVLMILSNHKTDKIQTLYKNYHIESVLAKRMINCKGLERQAVEELIITNFKENNIIESEFKNIIQNPLWYTDLSVCKKILNAYCWEIKELNTLIGASNFKIRFFILIKKNIKFLVLICLMFAVKLEEKINAKHKDIMLKIWDISNYEMIADQELEVIFAFIEKIGIVNLFVESKITDVYDYLLGVTVGLDSNARKNRSGKLMEKEVEKILIEKQKNHVIDYFVKQKKLDFIFNHKNNIFNFKDIDFFPKKDKYPLLWREIKKKRFDFIYTIKQRLFVIECNYYNGGGSKIDATIKQYQKLDQSINKLTNSNKFRFIWISDGFYWKSHQNTWKDIKNTVNLFSLKDFQQEKN